MISKSLLHLAGKLVAGGKLIIKVAPLKKAYRTSRRSPACQVSSEILDTTRLSLESWTKIVSTKSK
jgi:hypothetical protein